MYEHLRQDISCLYKIYSILHTGGEAECDRSAVDGQ